MRDASSAEGTAPEVLRLLVWSGYDPEKYVREFEREIEQKYGRRVMLQCEWVESSDDFFDPVRAKQVDLITVSQHELRDESFGYISKKMVLPIDLQNIPNYVHVMPSLRDAENSDDENVHYSVPIAMGPYGLGYHPQSVESAPHSWTVLWDPAYNKKYVLGAQEYLYNVNITALALGYPREAIGRYDALNNRAFKEKLRELAVHAKSFWIGADTAEDLQCASLAVSWGDSFSELNQRGEFWEMAAPKEGTLWWVDTCVLTWALADRPFMKKVAEEWINKTLSPEFQMDYLVPDGAYPVVPDTTDKLTPAEKAWVGCATDGVAAGKHILVKSYSRRDRNGLRLLWEEAMEGIDTGSNRP